MAAQKDTIYIDVDDEITSLVDKVNSSKSNIIALVLPKRAAVLQSIVNMKLLKRTADDSGKRVVLITSEAGLLPLAGAVGVYVAKNLHSKPEIPAAPESQKEDDELLETEDEQEPELDKNAAVEDLSDDDIFESKTASAEATAATKTKKSKEPKPLKAKGEKKSKIPNFDKFRTKIFLGIGGTIVLLALLYIAFFIMPKATISIKTETTKENSTIDFTASTASETVNIDNVTIPAKQLESEKTETQTVPATGEKDFGTKASGSVSMSIPCSSVSGVPPTIPAGTGVSTSGLTFITQSTVSLTTPSFSGGCSFTGSTQVKANENGDKYNISAGASFTVSGFSSVSGTNESAYTGGTSKIAKVVSQQDIDTAKSKITDNADSAKTELQKELEGSGYYAITDTFSTKQDIITSNPKLGQEATEVTVTSKRVYTMLGVKRDDLKALIELDVKDTLEGRKLQIQDDGINTAIFKVGKTSGAETSIIMQVQPVLGPRIDTEQLKKDIAGKKKGDIENQIKEIEGVKDVQVTYSPFWVSKTPKNISKITINLEEVQ